MNNKLRVAILAPYPLRMKYGDRLKFRTPESLEHPTSWVVNLLRLATDAYPEIDFHLVSFSSHLAHDVHLEDNGVHYHFLRGVPFRLQALTAYQVDRLILTRMLKHIAPDVVEAFGTEGPYAYSAVTTPYPCVVYMQGIVTEILKQMPEGLFTRFQWINLYITRYIERWTIRHGKTFIAENEFTAKFVRLLNPNARIYNIPNLINPLFFNIIRNPTEEQQDILFIGAINERKGALDLLSAFFIVQQRFPQCKLILIGPISDDMKNKIEVLAVEYGLIDSIQLCGQQTPEFIAKAMSRAAMLVHPSWMDSSPNSVLEAMAAGLPVIANRVGGIPFIIQDGETGLLCEPRRIDLLSSKIIELLQSDQIRLELGGKAKKWMKHNLNPFRIVSEYIKIYYDIHTDRKQLVL